MPILIRNWSLFRKHEKIFKLHQLWNIIFYFRTSLVHLELRRWFATSWTGETNKRLKAMNAINSKRGGVLCQRSLQRLHVKRLFSPPHRDNCRINGEITGQFARNDRCRGSITGCELRRRLKLLLVQKRQRLRSFLHHHTFALLPFVDISLSVRPAFSHSVTHSSNFRCHSSKIPRVLRLAFFFPSYFHISNPSFLSSL